MTYSVSTLAQIAARSALGGSLMDMRPAAYEASPEPTGPVL